MTIIIGFATGGKVYLGGDSAAVAGDHIRIRYDDKVFRNGPFIMGFTSSYRMGQLLRYGLNGDMLSIDAQECMDGNYFMVNTFVPAIRKLFKDGGFMKTKDGEDTGGVFLVGYRGCLYEIREDFQVARFHSDIACVGSGYEVAMGAIHALADSGLPPRELITKSLEIAALLNSTVRPPFIFQEC